MVLKKLSKKSASRSPGCFGGDAGAGAGAVRGLEGDPDAIWFIVLGIYLM